MTMQPTHFVLDVDGVMTDGKFHYTEHGKVMKRFGPHDGDGLKLISDKVAVQFISADHRGFSISKKRISDDMGYPLTLVSESERLDYVTSLGSTIAFMGDGIFDAPVIQAAFCGIAPRSARPEARLVADFVTASNAGDGAVLDACQYILGKYFTD